MLEKNHAHPNIRFTTWEDYAIMSMVERGLGSGSASGYDPETNSIPDRDPIIQKSIFQRNWTGNERQNKADSGNQEVYRISYDQ